MIVKLTEPMAGARAWAVGDEFECGEAEAVRLIAAGRAVAIENKIERAVKSAAPETRKVK